MCGICLTWCTHQRQEKFQKALEALKARGPDVTQIVNGDCCDSWFSLGFTRLHIQGAGPLTTTEQPYRLTDDDGSYVVCNGEIFNSDKIRETFSFTNTECPPGSSDCAVIPALLNRGLSLADVARQLDGDFAIVVVNPVTHSVQLCRDPYGVRPLFYNEWSVASELKGLVYDNEENEKNGTPHTVLPGTIVHFEYVSSIVGDNLARETRWHEVPWLKSEGFIDPDAWDYLSPDYASPVNNAFKAAVQKRLTTVRGLGACLSGGLDSSLVAAVAAQHLRKCGGPPLHTYSIGMAGSADLAHARLVADKIESIHHERIITPEEAIAAIPAVIRAIESFDITTVRASVGNYLLGAFIAEVTPDVKVVLNGDGADELFGGYLYMRNAPSDADFESEITRLLTEIHTYDVLRSERCMAAHGLESRSPFLDRQFVSVVRSIPTPVLRPVPGLVRNEKQVLRDTEVALTLLPEEVRTRRKEAFSDGVSGSSCPSWFEIAKAEAERLYPDNSWMNMSKVFFVINSPQTAEAFWYRSIFHTHYPLWASHLIPHMWMPRWVSTVDPSARTLTGIY